MTRGAVKALPEECGRGSGRRIRILDTAALILGFTEQHGEELMTCRSVLEEVSHGGAVLRAVSGIKVMEPSIEYVERVRAKAGEIGEGGLSETDIKVLALALQLSERCLETSIATSDYSVQNLASILGIKVEPLLHRGIRREIIWVAYCPLCGWSGGEKTAGESCPRCGSRLKRRPRHEDKNTERAEG